ncbi:MAG: anthranilate synthase component I family protein [Leptospiraceae bacterium]|nr:anthranilate synthase component I family protein [Leptospiraceae bacterium]MCP5502873.1 anthranilate synthase component I family protein [Leptospiraceae bacterium]
MIEKIQLPRKPVYKKIPISEEFCSLFRKLEQKYDNCFIFESLGEESYNSRYSILGFSPDKIFRARANTLYINDEAHNCENPYFTLRDIIPSNILSRNYAGGLVGYLSYEAMNYFEPSLKLPSHALFDDFVFGLYLDGLIYDKMTGDNFYFHYGHDRSDILLALQEEKLQENKTLEIELKGYTMTEEKHRESVMETIEEIKSGNTFQCQIGFKTEYSYSGSLFSVYNKLREVNPSPHMFCFKFQDTGIVGASPELLFRLHNGEMETYPLAGSIRRGKTKEEDLQLAKTLLNDPKEIAEHNMLVDLHRNDIGRVARFGSVKVRRLMDIKKFSHIQHISSEVIGLIKKGEDMFTSLAYNFPAGTLSGAPKIESMKIIHRIEKNPRGPYGGAIGHFGFNGNCTFAIPIRTFFVKGEYGYTQASGGIVYDSKPENEYDEVMRKSAAVKNVLQSLQKEGI